MAKYDRHKTSYPGVYYLMGSHVVTGKPERVYYIRYRKDGKLVEEKAGRQFQDNMTPAKANAMRGRRVDGEKSNQERREADEAVKQADLGRWTFNRLWEAYKHDKPNLKGLVTDENRFEKHLRQSLGSKTPDELVPLDVQRLKKNLGKNLAPGSVKNVLELLRRIINYGINLQLNPGPGFKIKLPKVNNVTTEDLNDEQLRALLLAIEEDPNRQAANIMKMALYTGMRRGELFKLKWDHVDFERGFILLADPKGGLDQRIPLNDLARQVLDGHERTDSPYVFPGREGKQRTDINRQIRRIKERAGLPKKFRALHGLRHVFASTLASSGEVDLLTLQKLLTHKSPQMTLRYAHLRDDALRRAAGVAESIFHGVQGKKISGEKKLA